MADFSASFELDISQYKASMKDVLSDIDKFRNAEGKLNKEMLSSQGITVKQAQELEKLVGQYKKVEASTMAADKKLAKEKEILMQLSLEWERMSASARGSYSSIDRFIRQSIDRLNKESTALHKKALADKKAAEAARKHASAEKEKAKAAKLAGSSGLDTSLAGTNSQLSTLIGKFDTIKTGLGYFVTGKLAVKAFNETLKHSETLADSFNRKMSGLKNVYDRAFNSFLNGSTGQFSISAAYNAGSTAYDASDSLDTLIGMNAGVMSELKTGMTETERLLSEGNVLSQHQLDTLKENAKALYGTEIGARKEEIRAKKAVVADSPTKKDMLDRVLNSSNPAAAWADLIGPQLEQAKQDVRNNQRVFLNDEEALERKRGIEDLASQENAIREIIQLQLKLNGVKREEEEALKRIAEMENKNKSNAKSESNKGGGSKTKPKSKEDIDAEKVASSAYDKSISAFKNKHIPEFSSFDFNFSQKAIDAYIKKLSSSQEFKDAIVSLYPSETAGKTGRDLETVKDQLALMALNAVKANLATISADIKAKESGALPGSQAYYDTVISVLGKALGDMPTDSDSYKQLKRQRDDMLRQAAKDLEDPSYLEKIDPFKGTIRWYNLKIAKLDSQISMANGDELKRLRDQRDEYQTELEKLTNKTEPVVNVFPFQSYKPKSKGLDTGGLGRMHGSYSDVNTHVTHYPDLVELYTEQLKEQQEVTESTVSSVNTLADAWGNVISALGDADSKVVDVMNVFVSSIGSIGDAIMSVSKIRIAALASQEGAAMGEGVGSAMKLPFPYNLAAAATVVGTIAGIFAQIISISRASKYADGGYIPGSSFSGDRIPAWVNSGELILNQNEQAVVKSLIGSGTRGGGTQRIEVYGKLSGRDIVLSSKRQEHYDSRH